MFNRTILAVAGLGAMCVALPAARADILADWTFEVSVPATAGPHAAEAGLNAASSFASGLHASGSVVYSNPVGNGSAESFSSNFWAIGDYYEFTTSTTGYQDILITWDQTRSSTGSAIFDLYWSVDGSSFNLLLNDYSVPVVTWSSTIPDPTGTTSFSALGPAALNNQATIYFRMVADAAAGGTSGSVRMDNVVISANQVPAPGAVAMLGLAGVMTRSRRRR